MRLPIVISATLLLSLGMNLPIMAETTVEIAPTQSVTNNNLNLRRLRFNRYLWNRTNISNYRITVSNSCFCTAESRGPVVITVRNGAITSVTLVATGQAVDPQLFQRYGTITSLFNVIQDAINRKAFSLDVRYDPKLGYPTQISVDYDSRIADEEIFLTIENFQKIK
jgi:hypothetical protein